MKGLSVKRVPMDGSEAMRKRILTFASLLAMFAAGLTTAQETGALESEVIQPIPKEACSTWCVCIILELIELPGGHSWYMVERHDELCSGNMDCGNPTSLFMLLPSGAPPDDCADEGCTYGNSIVALQKENGGRLASVLKSKVPSNFQPKFSPNFSGEIEIIHTDFVSFAVNDEKKTAKVFIVKVTPSVIDEDHPVRIAAMGFEVAADSNIRPSVTVTNQKNIEEGIFGVYQVNIGGTRYGILTTDEDRLAATVSNAPQPTLATK